MTLDAFVRIDGIEGESIDEKHKRWFETLAFKMGVKQIISPTVSSVGGASAERVDFEDFSFAKELDISSPRLALACAAGTHIDSVTVELCRAGGEKLKFMEYRMSNCIISDIATGGGRGEFPAEVVHINFGKIEWIYVQQRRNGGGAAGQIAFGWDLERNCKI